VIDLSVSGINFEAASASRLGEKVERRRAADYLFLDVISGHLWQGGEGRGKRQRRLNINFKTRFQNFFGQGRDGKKRRRRVIKDFWI